MIPFLAIASGAINIGKKIFGKIKERQSEKKEKRAAKQAKKDAKIAAVESMISGSDGSTPITESGNILAGLKGLIGGQVGGKAGEDPNIPDSPGSGGGLMDFFKTPLGIGIAIVLALLIGKKMKLF